MKKTKKASPLNELVLTIRAKFFPIIVIVLTIPIYFVGDYLIDKTSPWYGLFTILLGAVISTAAVSFFIEIFSINKLINKTVDAAAEKNQIFFDSSIQKIPEKISTTLNEGFVNYLNKDGLDRIFLQYLKCQYISVPDLEYREKIVESNCEVQKTVYKHYLNCELIENYEETINISIIHNLCTVQRIIKFDKNILSDYYNYQKVIWFSNKQNRDSFNKDGIKVLVNGVAVEKAKIHIDDIENIGNNEYGIKIHFQLFQGKRHVVFSYTRQKPITQIPTFNIFSFVCKKPRIQVMLTNNDSYKLDVVVLRNYEHFNNDESFLLNNEVVNHDNTTYDIEFPGWCLPGCGIAFWLQKKE